MSTPNPFEVQIHISNLQNICQHSEPQFTQSADPPLARTTNHARDIWYAIKVSSRQTEVYGTDKRPEVAILTAAPSQDQDTAFALRPHRKVRQESTMRHLDKSKKLGVEDLGVASSHLLSHQTKVDKSLDDSLGKIEPELATFLAADARNSEESDSGGTDFVDLFKTRNFKNHTWSESQQTSYRSGSVPLIQELSQS